MTLFLDSSVTLAACASTTGASRHIINSASAAGRELLTSEYSIQEVRANVPRLGTSAIESCERILPKLAIVPDVVSFPWVTVFPPAKDRPILFTAACYADVLVTLDRKDFQGLLGMRFYMLQILTPEHFVRLFRT